MCDNGRWSTECCSGSGGCSCGGQMVDMGPCRVCGGTGVLSAGSDTGANVDAIAGYGYIGTGPASGGFGAPALGYRAEVLGE